MAREQTIAVGTPFRDQVYAAVACSWLCICPRPESWLYAISHYIPFAHNRLVEEFLKTDCDRLLLIEDDIAVHPLIVARAQRHQADVVTGVVRSRYPPYRAMFFPRLSKDGGRGPVSEARLREMVRQPGEHPIQGSGTAIVSIARCVLEGMPRPWFEQPESFEGGFAGHDLTFWHRVGEAGYSRAVDTDPAMWGKHVGWNSVAVEDHL